MAGSAFSNLPVLVSTVCGYEDKGYPKLPIGTIMLIASALLYALLYFLSPIDCIPDSIPSIRYVDDAAVVLACLKLVQSDVDEYREWQSQNK